MNQRKSIVSLAFLLICAAAFFGKITLPSVQGLEFNYQTIPTRTPVPPTATQSSGGGAPTATYTAQPQASPTSTLLPVTFAPTPIGGFIATAVPCGSNPTIQALGATNVRSGPGIAYDVIGQLVYLEVRLIVGRAGSAEWWLIQFNNGQLGWVANEIVLVQGYIPVIPIVEAPPLANGTPTPGPAWNPTPIPFCTVTPIPTEAPTATPVAETAVILTSATPTPTATEPAPTEIRPTDTPIVQPTAVPLNPTAPVETSVPTPPEENGSNTGILLLGLGLLIAIGGIVLYLRRR